MNTPVLFLIFNRPDMTAQVFQAIARAKPEKLFVAADGPRTDVDGEATRCQAARDVISRIDWNCEVQTLFRDKNMGCRIAVSSAIDWFFEHVEEGIILEDDCLPSDSFFPFCSELLERYRDDERVMMISGNNFQNGIRRGDASYYFSQIPHIWGWATWRRAWALYDRDMQSFPEFVNAKAIQTVSKDVDVQNYWLSCFIPTYRGQIDTWDYQWMYAVLERQGLTVCPQQNLVSNIGFGTGATHTTDSSSYCAFLPSHHFDDALIYADAVVLNGDADLYLYRRVFDVGLRSVPICLRWKKRWRKQQKIRRLVRSFAD